MSLYIILSLGITNLIDFIVIIMFRGMQFCRLQCNVIDEYTWNNFLSGRSATNDNVGKDKSSK